MPTSTDTETKVENDSETLLWQALKEHILLERQKKKEEQAAVVEEERLRKEREARDRQDAMTLGETREQIQLLNNKLEELRNEKQQLFLRLKKVLNEDENRKRQQQQKDSEMFLQNIVQQGSHSQIFLPPRAPHQQLMQKYLQGSSPIGNQPIKRSRSPSPTKCYYKTNNTPFSLKHEEGRRSGEVARAVLWNKPTYQNPSGTLYYPTNQQDSRGQSIIYPTYPLNINNTLRQNYHMDIGHQPPPQQHQSSSQQQQIKSEPKTTQTSQVFLDQQQQSSHSPQPHPQQQHKNHPQNQQMSMEKIAECGYHIEMKQDERKDRLIQQQQTQQQTQQQQQLKQNHIQTQPQQQSHQQPQQQPTGQLPDGNMYASLKPVIPPIHSIVTTLPANQGNLKPTGSITQGYASRGNVPQGLQQTQSSQIHYQRHRY